MRNHLITFRILDVLHPRPEELLRSIHGENLLQGVVLDVAQGKSPDEQYAIVQLDGVKGVREPVIVPLARVVEEIAETRS